jgi:hypothetical protein
MVLNYVSLFIIFMCVTIIVIGIWKIHTLPGVIAKQRNHPQAEAIEITAYLGLIAFPLWMAALIWAYTRPVLQPIDIVATPDEPLQPETSPTPGDGVSGSAQLPQGAK